MIVLYDYLLFALELAGILYFMRGLPLREMGESEAVQRLFRSALLTVMPLLLALRSGLVAYKPISMGISADGAVWAALCLCPASILHQLSRDALLHFHPLSGRNCRLRKPQRLLPCRGRA